MSLSNQNPTIMVINSWQKVVPIDKLVNGLSIKKYEKEIAQNYIIYFEECVIAK